MLHRIKNALWALRGPNLPLSELDRMMDEALDWGPETTSGVHVTERSGFRQATVYSCINILSRDMSSLPLKLYERTTGGGNKEVKDHPLAKWLRRPNPWQTSLQWRQRGWYSTLASGNQYDLVRSNGLGLIETTPLDSSRVEVVFEGGQKRYRYLKADGSKTLYRTDQIFHNFGISFNGFEGISPIRHCMETVGRAIAVGEYGAAYFRSPVPKIIFKHPTGLKPEDQDRFVKMWVERFAGKRGLSSAAVLPGGMDVAQIAKIPNNEAQFLETQRFGKEEIAQIYLVPMHRLQALERATFSNIEHQALEYVQYSLLPWLTAQEQAIELQFLTDAERERYFVRHNVDGLLRGDYKTRMEGHSLSINSGLSSINERRALENLPAMEGGDDLIVPLNMTRLVDLQAPEQEPEPDTDPGDDEPPPDDEDERQIKLNRAAGIGGAELRSAQARRKITQRWTPKLTSVLHEEIKTQAAAIASQGAPLLRTEQRDTSEFLAWLEEFVRGRTESLTRAVRPVFSELAGQIAEQAGAEVGNDPPPNAAPAIVARFTQNFATQWNDRSVRELQQAALDAQTQGEDPAEAVTTRLSEWEEGTTGSPRAEQEARHEAVLLANIVARAVFVAFGFRLVWATFGKSCAYCSAMRGKRVSGSEDFAPSGEFNPAGASKPLKIRRGVRQPPLHRGCSCALVPG